MPSPPIGVIESLTQGFETAASRLGLLLLPLLLDLFLWLGPRASFAPAIHTFVDGFQHNMQSLASESKAKTPIAWDDVKQALELQMGGVETQYFPLIGIPTVLAAHKVEPLPFDYSPSVIVFDTLGGFIAVRIALLAGGLILGTVYAALVAQVVINNRLTLASFTRLPLIIVQLVLLGVMAIAVLLVVIMPFMLLAALASMISPGLAQFVLLVGQMLILWIGLFGVFTLPGMLVNQRNLFAALWDSIRLVQWNLMPTIFLLVIGFVINIALGIVWSLAGLDSWLVLAAIGGHAFVTTGIMASRFVFFKDRYRYWRELREQLLAELDRRREKSSQQA